MWMITILNYCLFGRLFYWRVLYQVDGGHFIICVKYDFIVWRERKPTRCNNQMFIINFCLNMFRASLCPSSGEQRPCYCIWCTALVLLDVVGSGCGALHCRMRALLASYNAAPHNRYQPQPAEPEQYTICSNTVFVLPKMGIMMPETCWDRSW